jgi:hypothetical protein
MSDILTEEEFEALPICSHCGKKHGRLYDCWTREQLHFKVERLEEENEKLKQALHEIYNPVWWIQERCINQYGSLVGFNGHVAVALSNDASYLKNIAKHAMEGVKYKRPEREDMNAQST